MAMNMKLVKHGDSADVLFEGRMDATSAPQAEKALLDVAERFQSVNLDMEKLEYISSAGLRALRNFNMVMRRGGKEYKVKNVPKTILEVFEMTGYSRLLRL
jgi:anti-sigma B factor antagonist